MANLDDDKVLDVVLGEAASVAKHGKQASYEDMLAIASVIANRSRQLGVPPKDVVSVKSEFNAQKPAPGMEAYRDLARQAVQQVATSGPVHSATFYATPSATGRLPSGLQPVTQTATHSFFSDPQNRSIRTAAGYRSPQAPPSFSPAAIPTPTPSPRRTNATPTIAPRGNVSQLSRANMSPVDYPGSFVPAYAKAQRNQAPDRAVTDFAQAATTSYFGPGHSFVGYSGKGRSAGQSRGSSHIHGRAVDGYVVDHRTGEIVTDKDKMYGFAAHMAKMDPHIDIGYDQRARTAGGYMGPGRIHIGSDRTIKGNWGPNRSWTSMDKPLLDMITEARRVGETRPFRSTLGKAVFPATIDSRVQPTPRAQALASMQMAARAQTAPTPLVANPNSNIIAPVRTTTTLAPVNTSVASRVPVGASIAPVQQQPLSPNVATAQRFTPVAPSQIAAPVRSTTVAPVAPSPASTRSVQTSTVAPAVTATPVSVLSSAPSARSAQEASMSAYNSMRSVPTPTPNPRGFYANRPADTPAMDAAMAEATRGAKVYDGVNARSNPVMGSNFRGYGAGGLLGNILTGNSQFGVGGNMRGAIAGGLLGGLLAGPMGIAAGAAIGNRLGSDGGLLSGMLSGGQDNSGSFTAANPAGGRGLIDLSGGPVSLGSITATPTPSSGGYRSVDSGRGGTGWSSYSNPTTGITTTFDAQGNTLGGPGMAPDVGGNSPGGK